MHNVRDVRFYPYTEELFKFSFKLISNRIETIQLNCNTNQMTGFYTSERYALNGLKGIIHVNIICTFSLLASAKDYI